MDESKKIPDLYSPQQPCPPLTPEDLKDVETGALCSPCPSHGNYVVRFYGATFSQSSKTGKVTVVSKYPVRMMVSAN